ncbi:MAG: hypothetical protein FD149_1963 [Rhodospirillaceae bacterium]|nr:MAG: hypothetical protein FD149_1963 [Rhodospirillaceae bacterium]
MSLSVPQDLYARTAAFIQRTVADAAIAAGAKRVSAGLIGYFVHVLEFDSWCVFRAALGRQGAEEVSARVMDWRHAALQEGDESAAWGYELVALNLAALAKAEDPDAAEVLHLTDSILRKAIAEATPLDHETPRV